MTLQCILCGDFNSPLGCCTECSGIFCDKCIQSENRFTCPHCNHEIVKLKIEESEIFGINVLSLSSQSITSPNVILYKLSSFPKKIPIKEIFEINDPTLTIIICQDAKSLEKISFEYQKEYSADNGRLEPSDDAGLNLYQETGYRIIKPSLDNEIQYVFLNLSALEREEIKPIIKYVSRLNRHQRDGISVGTDRIFEEILKGESRLYHEIGFHSFGPYNAILSIIIPLRIEIRASWVEYQTITDIVDEFTSVEITRLINRRLEMFEKITNHIVDDEGRIEVCLPDLAVKIIRMLSVCESIISIPNLFNASIKRVQNQIEEIAKSSKLIDVESLGHAALEFFSNVKESIDFTNGQTYESSISNALSKSYFYLKPQFYMTNAMLYLTEMVRTIGYQLSFNDYISLEPSIRIFLDECKTISENPKTPEHLALYARMSASQILHFLGYHIIDSGICKEIETITLGNINNYFDRISKIKKDYEQYPIREDDLLFEAIGGMGVCYLHGEFDAANRLKEIILLHKDHPTSKTPMASIYWLDFISFEDYDSLAKFRAILPEVRTSHEPKNEMLEETFEVESLIADAISIKEHRMENFEKARLSLGQIEVSQIMQYKEILQNRALEIFLETVPFLYSASCAQSFPILMSDLTHAVDSSSRLSINERPESSNLIFYHKCLLLRAMAHGEMDLAKQIIHNIRENPFSSKTSELLCTVVESWISSRTSGGDLVQSTLDLHSDSISPWVQIAYRLLSFLAGKEYYITLSNYMKENVLSKKSVGESSNLKGLVLETAICLCYCKDGYEPTQRFIFDGKEIIDILCCKNQGAIYLIRLIDVKGKHEAYGLTDARDFACRANTIKKNIEKIIPMVNEMKYEIMAIVASDSKISPDSIKELDNNLDDIPFEIKDADRLRDFLDTHGVRSSLFLASIHNRPAQNKRTSPIKMTGNKK